MKKSVCVCVCVQEDLLDKSWISASKAAAVYKSHPKALDPRKKVCVSVSV